MALRALWQRGRTLGCHLQSLTCASHTFTRLQRPSVSSFHTTSKDLLSFNVQDEDDFKKRVLESDVPVLVDFHANWCGPCKLLGPRLEEVVAASDGSVNLAKVDIDELVDIAMLYKVSSVPTVVAVKGGQTVDQFIGLKEKEYIEDIIAKISGVDSH